MPELCKTIWFMLNTCFPSRNQEFCYVLDRGYLLDQPPVKALGTESKELLWQITFHTCYRNSLLEELSISCVTALGEGSGKFAPSFLGTLFSVPFPFADFAR